MKNRIPRPEIESAFSLWRWLRLILALLVLVGLFSSTFPVASLDRRLGDLCFRLRAQQTSTAVALVLIDDATLARYGRWPWPRRDLARLVRAIASEQPKAIGIDILLPEPEDQADDAALAQAIADAHNVVLATKISGSPTGSLWVDPLPAFTRNAAALGHVQATLDADGACRRIPLVESSVEGPRFALALKLAEFASPELIQKEAGDDSRDTKHPVTGVERIVPRYLTINYRHQLVGGQATPPFVAIPAGGLLDGKDGRQLKDKIVILGFGATEITDRLFTPVSDQTPMPGVEVNANVVDTLISDNEVQEPGMAAQVLSLAGLSILFLWAVVRWPGPRGLLLLAGMLMAAFAAGYLLFVRFHLLVHYGAFLVAAVVAAPVAQLENLVIVESAVTRRLKDLQELLVNRSRSSFTLKREPGPIGDSFGSHFHWKLTTLGRLQEELASLYKFDETLIETMEEPLAVFSVDGQLIFYNASWQRFCQRQGLEERLTLVGFVGLMRGWHELLPPAGEPGRWVEKEAPFKHGLWRVRAARLPHISQADPGAVMVLLEDVSARHERDLARAEALSFVTHELRTPLIAIQGFAEFLTRYPEKSAASEAPATIFRESRRLVAMINAYLEVLRLDSGSRPLNLRPVNVVDVVKHVDSILQPLAQAARIRLRAEYQLEVPVVECDEPLVSGALLNLLSNAIKYSPTESEVILHTLSNQNTVEFAVHNLGPAIPADELNRLFEPFYRGSQQVDAKPGWGIGLAFVKRISEQHGGRVEVKSDEGSGTCFRMLLPIGTRAGTEVLR